MRTILIAHRNVGFANSLALALSVEGYSSIVCPGPWPPALRCIRCDVGYCPLSEGADLLIYDPEMMAVRDDGLLYNLAADTATAHPDIPLLVAWPGSSEPPEVGSLLAAYPSIERAPREARDLVDRVRALVGGPFEHAPAPTLAIATQA